MPCGIARDTALVARYLSWHAYEAGMQPSLTASYHPASQAHVFADWNGWQQRLDKLFPVKLCKSDDGGSLAGKHESNSGSERRATQHASWRLAIPKHTA